MFYVSPPLNNAPAYEASENFLNCYNYTHHGSTLEVFRKQLRIIGQKRETTMNSILKILALALLTIALAACISRYQAVNVNDICKLFNLHPDWYQDTQGAYKKWGVPIVVQMAIIKQESTFVATARPKGDIPSIFPDNATSSAYGYAQALNGTWDQYKKDTGDISGLRTNFAAATDFIGWFTHQAHKELHIPLSDAYSLYLAYHEGLGGYRSHSYWKKPWLLYVARNVRNEAALYQSQLPACLANLTAKPLVQAVNLKASAPLEHAPKLPK